MRARSFFLFLVILFLSTESHAFDGISLGAGRARVSIDIYRVGLRKQFDRNWFESRVGHLSGYHEISLNYLKHGEESMWLAAYSPVFTYSFPGLTKLAAPYIEGGIGISLLSDKMIAGRDLSTYFQFEDRIGVGLRIGRRHTHDLNFRYMHYSNASIKQPNDGLDILMVSYSFYF
ncbi:MAG: acyloxyacyl hydrolase [Candidatus Zixiibacteriota bacterium]|nr:MAG: acyloxyacyl hydrolase [candidate division Zixibacteria bacterium]